LNQKCSKVDQRLKRLGLEPSFQWKLQRNTLALWLGLGQVTWAKMTQKLLHLWHHSQKTAPPTKKYFLCRLESWPIHWAIEQLSSAISRGTMALIKQPKTAGFRPKSKHEYIVRRFSKCLKKIMIFINPDTRLFITAFRLGSLSLLWDYAIGYVTYQCWRKAALVLAFINCICQFVARE